MRCVLVRAGRPPFLFVQIVSGERTIYSERVIDFARAALAADDLKRTFVKTRDDGTAS
jgi:hypothetical protein